MSHDGWNAIQAQAERDRQEKAAAAKALLDLERRRGLMPRGDDLPPAQYDSRKPRLK